ncbi:hypothetical protein [Arthrobacter sulfonylureivorans]|uniref:Uncharacterized protein n=1 Tax=Arthrobacter sulfonylureivorans TaxID=2486855 RepID=A0ABY3W439_9MICC|nr:hypothetical protein [Arthrobacter sulfonylureivorans]UNK44937.1 hypothetical protein MNQ99_13370 [Arthrobacter sulfonylureivorans]
MAIEEDYSPSSRDRHQSPDDKPEHRASEEHVPADDERAIARRRKDAEDKLEEHRREAEQHGHPTGGRH